MINGQGIFPLVIIFLLLITFSCDNLLMLLGGNNIDVSHFQELLYTGQLGFRKVPSCGTGQVDFHVGQLTFSAYLTMGKGLGNSSSYKSFN